MIDLQERILDLVQAEFPITVRPFAALGELLEMSEADVLAQLQELQRQEVIRRFGAVFDAARLGYVTTLVAAEVPADQLADFVAAVNSLPGVSHNYGRRHRFNVWFTFTMPDFAAIDRRLDALRRHFRVNVIHSLPAQTIYKMRLDLRFGQVPGPDEAVAVESPWNGAVRFAPSDKALVRQLAQGLPLAVDPFNRLAEQLQCHVNWVVEQVNHWCSAGVIRRFGIVLDHRKLGMVANGLAVFNVEPERADDLGCALARYPEVSHCYRRPRAPDWPYDLFATIHCRDLARLDNVFQDMVHQLEPRGQELLLTTDEYKKAPVPYFTAALDEGARQV